MDIRSYYLSLTAELESLKDRVRNFIEDHHWLTDGEWKESVLRSLLAQKLPETIRVGRGFILTQNGPSTQCDILLYDASAPILFRDGELVFLTPDVVRGIIEVKSRATLQVLNSALAKFSDIGRKMGDQREHCFFGLFSYESDLDARPVLNALRRRCNHESAIVDYLSLGCSMFIRWWKSSPSGGEACYERWHSYRLDNMSAGYFLSNVVHFVSPDSVGKNNWLWFPEHSKEARKIGDIAFRRELHE